MSWWILRQINSEESRKRQKGIQKLVARRKIDVLSDLLNHERTEIQCDAATGLGAVGDEQCVELLANTARKAQTIVRQSAINALAKIPNAASLEILASSFCDPEVHNAARNAIQAIGGEQATAILTKFLDHKEPWLQRAAAHSLRSLNWQPSGERESLAYATGINDWELLATLGDVAIPALDAGVQDPMADTSRAATEALANMNTPAAITPLVLALTRSNSNIARQALNEKYPNWSTSVEARRAVPSLIEALRNGSETSAGVLAEIGDERAVQPLVEALHDPRVYVSDGRYPLREAALDALVTFGDGPIELIVEEFRKGDVNEHVAKALIVIPLAAKRTASKLIEACVASGNLSIAGLKSLLAVDVVDGRLFDPLLRPMFASPKPHGYYSKSFVETLDRLLPISSLSKKDLQDAISASCYYQPEYGESGGQIYARKEIASRAITRLCERRSSVTSNLLHLVAGKGNVVVSDVSTERFWEREEHHFGEERRTATEELANRGNPAYDREAFAKPNE